MEKKNLFDTKTNNKTHKSMKDLPNFSLSHQFNVKDDIQTRDYESPNIHEQPNIFQSNN